MAHKFEERIHSMVDSLLEDYSHGRTIDRTVAFEQPDREKIIEMIYQLRNIIYPGYFKNDRFKVYTVRNNISMLLEDIIFNLSRQTALVLPYSQEYEMGAEQQADWQRLSPSDKDWSYL